MSKKYSIIAIALLFFSTPAYAYLDPGTGSMLLYFIMGIFATLIYSGKEFFYKISALVSGGRSDSSFRDLSNYDFVFYSEGSSYWSTFAPVIEVLLDEEKRIAFYTSGESDPALNIKNDNFNAKFIGKGTTAFVLLNRIKANIVIMTTPQLDIMQLKRSKDVNHYVHLIHSPTDVLQYRKFAFDYFDSVMCSGQHQIDNIRALEKKRGLPKKLLLKTGLTYYDVMLKAKSPQVENKGQPTILIAPTWGRNGLFMRFGSSPIKAILDKNFQVIIRPHPQSYVSEPILMKQIETELSQVQNIEWDKEASPENSMARSDVLLSDVSGIVFDFFFIYQKPVVLIEGDVTRGGFEAEDVDTPIWEIEIFPKISTIANGDNISQLPEIVQSALDKGYNAEDSKLLDSSLFNFGTAGIVASNQLNEISEGLS